MPLVTRAVFGFVYRADGTAIAAAPVSIRSFAGVYQPDGSVAPATLLTPITNNVGRYDVVLVVNARYLIGIPGDVFEIIVPSGVGSVSVESLRATTGVVMTNAVQIALEAVLAVHATLTTTAHGGLVAAGDGRLTDARTPTGTAGGVLSGNYPSPSFAADMATQAELDAALLLKENALGNPDVSGKVLARTVGGISSWVTLPSGGATALTWNTIASGSLGAGWIYYGSGFGDPAYSIVGNGMIKISGAIFRSSGVVTTLFTVPVGARPSVIRYVAKEGGGTIRINTDGTVVLWGGSAAPCIFDGIEYRL